jgi:hypothetical protein
MWKSQGLLSSFYLYGKYHDFLAVFALAHSKINQNTYFFNEIILEVSD